MSPHDQAPTPIPSTTNPARVIDTRYRLIAPLGEGGMGTVYEAEHVFTGRRVAVKLLLPQAAHDPDLVRRFLEEARSAARVAHPYCVDILDMGQEPDGTLYLVQELLIGMDLRRHLLQVGRCLSPAETLEIALPIIEALGAAHAHGVVHRDVKPSNIFLVTGGDGARVPKLIDFGTAKMIELGMAAQPLTRTGRAIGTPSHMAPEQLRADRHLDGRTDIWAMGIVLYEMLTGHRPFEATNPHVLAVQILTTRPARIETHCPEIPPALAAVIHHALEPDREARLASMEAMREALLAAVGSEVRATGSGRPAFTQAAPAKAVSDAPVTSETVISVRFSVPPDPDEPDEADAAADPDDLENLPSPARHSRLRVILSAALITLCVAGVAGVLSYRSHLLPTTEAPLPVQRQPPPPLLPTPPAGRVPAVRVPPSVQAATVTTPPPPTPAAASKPIRQTSPRAKRPRPPKTNPTREGTNGAPILE